MVVHDSIISGIPALCTHCQNPFMRRNRRTRITHEYFCSRLCLNAYKNVQSARFSMQICAQCHTSFQYRRGHPAIPTQVFCNMQCLRLYQTDLPARFWERVQRGSSQICWLWQGRESAKYGHFNLNRESHYAHRVAYELTYGLILLPLYVCHRCDNPPCCNPRHLFLGTSQDNMEDCIRKGRHSCGERPRGEQHANAKLTTEQVQEIRRLSLAGDYSYHNLSAMFQVSKRTIQFVVKGQTWAHII